MDSTSQLWRIARAGKEAGCLDKILDMPWHKQAFIVATVETENELRNVQDWIATQPKDTTFD